MVVVLKIREMKIIEAHDLIAVVLKNLNDKGKLVERQGRKAKGPVKWQPATEMSFLL